MFCAIITAGVRGVASWRLDKHDELTSNSLISTDNSSAICKIIIPFFLIFRNLVDFFTRKYEITPYNLTFPNKAFAESHVISTGFS